MDVDGNSGVVLLVIMWKENTLVSAHVGKSVVKYRNVRPREAEGGT